VFDAFDAEMARLQAHQTPLSAQTLGFYMDVATGKRRIEPTLPAAVLHGLEEPAAKRRRLGVQDAEDMQSVPHVSG
jgi:hypothetical protein